MRFFDTVELFCGDLAVIRTSAPRPRFIASTGLNAELHQAVGRCLQCLGALVIFLSVLREKRAEGNPLHAFTSPDGVAVVLAPTESSVT